MRGEVLHYTGVGAAGLVPSSFCGAASWQDRLGFRVSWHLKFEIFHFVILWWVTFQKRIFCSCVGICRLGPSASQAAVDDDKVSELVQALSLLQSTMSQPWARDLMRNLGFGADSEDVAAAREGRPAPSRPTPAPLTSLPALPRPPSVPFTAPLTPGSVSPASGAAPKSSTPSALPAQAEVIPAVDEGKTAGPAAPKEVDVVNSSTHRAAHARLARRMASMPEAECPNMTRLWNGTRKDCVREISCTCIKFE